MKPIVILLPILMAAFSGARLVSAAEPLPEFSGIRSVLEQELLTLNRLVVTFERTYERSSDVSDTISVPDLQTWKWAKDGKRERVSMQPLLVEDPLTGNEHWMQTGVALDGDIVTRVNYAADDPEAILGAARSNNLAEFDRQLTPTHFVGLRLVECERDLLSLIHDDSASMVGWEEVGGEQCVHVKVEGVEMRDGFRGTWDFWLSPANRFLPRRIESHSSFKTPTVVVKFDEVFEVLEFRELTDERLDRKRPFPSVMVNSGRGWTSRLNVTSLEIGETVRADLVAFKMPDGAEIHEMLDGKPLRIYLAGQNSEAAVRQKLVDQAHAMSPPSDLDARPVQSGWPNIAAWGLALILMVAAVTVWYRQTH